MVTTSTTRLSGTEWEDWANQILSCHYGPTEYQRIPDRDRGDAGLEGFSRSDGHAFQAYGCEEPLGTKERYEKQRIKMTDDVTKFIDNRARIQRLLGSVRITRWVLFVPFHDSGDIVAHAAKKTAEVLLLKLPYVADSFQVCICQEADFPIARDKLINASSSSLQITSEPSTPEQIADWAALHHGPSSTLSEKLKRLPTLSTDQARLDFHNKVLDWYLQGQEILAALRQYPDVYAKVRKAKSHREGFLAMGAVSGLPPQEILIAAINDLRLTLEEGVRELHRFSSEKLTYEGVADWLLRCPLYFPEVATNG